jgi:hypothetical protein
MTTVTTVTKTVTKTKKTNGAKTFIVGVLDRSGSMESIRSDMEGALNTFIADQKKVPGECRFSLVQFDDRIETVYNADPLESVGRISLQPRGATALLDAMGRALAEARAYVKTYKPKYKIAAIVSDGLENASREWTRDKIFGLITDMRAEGWEITFMGTNQDAIQTGLSYGIAHTHAINFAADMGSRPVAAAFSSNTSALRSATADSLAYTTDQRKSAMGEETS